MNPGRYWFIMTQRHQQTGWATPKEVARDIPYNPYGDPYAVGARGSVSFVGLPPQNYKETFPSQVVEIIAQDPWNVATVRLGPDTQPRPHYFMTTPEGQNAQPFPIAPQIYYAFYVSNDAGATWSLLSTQKYRGVKPFSFQMTAIPRAPRSALGHLRDDLQIGKSVVWNAPPPPQEPPRRASRKGNDTVIVVVGVGLLLLIALFLFY